MAVPVNPLTPFWLGVTTFFETGLGVAAFVCWAYIIPKLRERALVESPYKKFRWVHPNRIINYFWFTNWLGVPGWEMKERTEYENKRTYIFYAYGAKGLAYLALFVTFAILIFNIGWVNPFTYNNYFHLNIPGWLFDLLFARANAQPNGAHVVSYIALMLIGVVTLAIFRDPFLSLAMIAFGVTFHEGPWEAAYYAVYSQFITSWALLTNVLKDVSFSSMIILFYYTLKRYKYRPFPMGIFKWPAIIYCSTIIGWVFVPYLFGYGLMPITTLNNFLYGMGIYSETVWWANVIVNGIEVSTWIEAPALILGAILLWLRRTHTNIRRM